MNVSIYVCYVLYLKIKTKVEKKQTKLRIEK